MSNPFKLQNGSIFVVTEAPGGLYNPEQLKVIADMCEKDAVVTKVTEDQRLGLIIGEDKYAQVAEQLVATGLGLRHYQGGLHQPVSCLGAHCPKMEQDALSTAMQLTDALAEKQSKLPMRIAINGCATSCVPSHTLDFSIVGEANGYRVSIGGKNSQLPEMASFIAEGVPADMIVELVGKAIDTYNLHAEGDESLQDVVQRLGLSLFVQDFSPYSQDAAPDSDPFSELPAAAAPDVEASLKPDDLAVDDQLDSIPSSEETALEIEPELIEDDLLSEPAVDGLSAANTDSQDVDLNLDDVKFGEDDAARAPTVAQDHGFNPEELLDVESIEFEPAQAEVDNMVAAAAPVPAAPAAPAAPAVDVDLAGMNFEEVALEAKLEESIAEQDLISNIASDENLSDRTQALDLVEQGTVTPIRNNFNESFDDEATISDELTYEDMNDSAPQEERKKSDRKNSGGFEAVQSVSINEEFTTLSFSTGASLTIDMSKLRETGGRRTFTVNGQEISVRLANGNLFVGVDGLEISFPEAA